MIGRIERAKKTKKYIYHQRVVSGFIAIMMMVLMVGLGSGTVYAEEGEILLDVDQRELTLGMTTTMTLTYRDVNGAENIGVIGLNNFDYQKIGTQTQVNVINGKTTRENVHTYRITPKSIGEFSLQVSYEIKGKEYFSNAVDVSVKEQDETLGEETEPVFIRTVLSDEEVYVGEKIVLTYELYSAFSVNSYNFVGDTTMEGFVAEDVTKEDYNQGNLTINGQKYNTYDLKQVVLNPTGAGTYQIPSIPCEVTVQSGFTSAKANLVAEGITIEVKELPTEGRPDDFSGLVGSLEVTGSFDKIQVDEGMPITLNVELKGDVNLSLLESVIDEKALKDFTVYETEKPQRDYVSSDGYVASKKIEAILVPKSTGTFEVVPVNISYFNTETGMYEVASLSKQTLEVISSRTQGGVAGSDGLENNGTGLNPHNNGPIRISNITYDTGDNDFYHIKIRKSSVMVIISSIVGLIIISLLGVIGLKQWQKSKSPHILIKKQIRKATSNKELYDLLREFLIEQYEVDLRSSSTKEVINTINLPEINDMLQSIIVYMEHGKYRGQNKLEEMRKNIFEVVNALEMNK